MPPWVVSQGREVYPCCCTCTMLINIAFGGSAVKVLYKMLYPCLSRSFSIHGNEHFSLDQIARRMVYTPQNSERVNGMHLLDKPLCAELQSSTIYTYCAF